VDIAVAPPALLCSKYLCQRGTYALAWNLQGACTPQLVYLMCGWHDRKLWTPPWSLSPFLQVITAGGIPKELIEPPPCPRYLNSSNYFPYLPLALPHISVDRSCWTLLHPGRGGASFLPTHTRLSLGEHCIDSDSCPRTAPRGRLVRSRCQISADVAR